MAKYEIPSDWFVGTGDTCSIRSHTSVGSYPVAYLYEGSVLCALCVDKSIADIVADVNEGTSAPPEVGPNWEDPNLRCCECSIRIESAYNEPEEA